MARGRIILRTVRIALLFRSGRPAIMFLLLLLIMKQLNAAVVLNMGQDSYSTFRRAHDITFVFRGMVYTEIKGLRSQGVRSNLAQISKSAFYYEWKRGVKKFCV